MLLRSIARCVFLCALPACVSPVPLENLPCPCAAGWTCCSDQNVCVHAGTSCPNTALAVTPPSAQVRFGGTLALHASEPVSWSLAEGELAGSIAADGTYRAPLTNGPFHVIATSVARPDEKVRVEVTVGLTHLEVLVGHIGGFGNADGWGPDARFSYNLGPVVGDGRNSLFVADLGNRALRKIDTASGQVTTLAQIPAEATEKLAYDARSGLFLLTQDYSQGKQGLLFAIDPVTGATQTSNAVPRSELHSSATGLAVDGDFLYELDDRRIFRRPLAGGTWQVVAGALPPGLDDGVGEAARFVALRDVAADGHGGLRLLDCYIDPSSTTLPSTCAIRSYDPKSSAVTTLHQITGTWGSLTHGLFSLASDQDFDFLVVGKAVWDGNVRMQLGSWNNDSVDAPATYYESIFAQADQVYIADTANAVIRRVGPLSYGSATTATTVTTLAGRRPHGGAFDGSRFDASFGSPRLLAGDERGGLVLLDYGRMRYVDAQGTVSSPAGAAGSWKIDGLVVEQGQYLYSSPDSNVIGTFDPQTGHGSILAGDYMFYSGNRDGVGFAAAFNHPSGVSADGKGNLYIADTGNGSIRRLAIASATVSTIATGLGAPLAVAAGDGEVFVAEKTALRRVRISSGEVKTLSGAEAGWKQISAIVYDPAGILYVCDTADQRVRGVIVHSGQVFDVVGKSGVTGVRLAALPAGVNVPSGLVLLPSGELVISSAAESALLIAR